ncbi:hypothetical protein C8R45DRAFT_495687 [Mycena sanguinolenta]|nr:hypothetical protein C8R45DRAFT_495687 [Mycena sanguinolenta]
MYSESASSLPSAEVAELLPLIGTIDPKCIFTIFGNDVSRRMLAWLKKIPSAPKDLIKLWEDYECMASFERTVQAHRSAKRIFPCSPEFLRILVPRVVFPYAGLRQLRGRLDLTWTEMRTSICGPSSNLATDELRLAVHLAFRDVALQCIRKMVKNELDVGRQVYSWESRDAALESVRRTGRSVNATYSHILEQRDLARAISLLVSSSPPCDVLYRELWCIPTWFIGSSLIYHVSKWLESFPDHTTGLIAFWKQAYRFDSEPVEIQDFQYAGNGCRDVVNDWNRAIVRLRLPNDLKFPPSI